MKWQRLAVLALLAIGFGSAAAQTISLAGKWRFELDRRDIGEQAHWPSRALAGRVQVPVDLAAQGIGDEISLETPWTGTILDSSFFLAPEYADYRRPGKIKVPFWLQPEKYYRGAAWYQRGVIIPVEWSDGRVQLFIERAHWETRVWIDGRFVGSQNALATPHVYELDGLTTGKHVLTVRIDNRVIVPVGVNAHSISDHTQGNWHGMVGRIELIRTPAVWIQDLQVYPDVASGSVLVKGKIGSLKAEPETIPVSLDIDPGQYHGSALVQWDSSGGVFSVNIPMGESAALWDEFHPFLYQLTARLPVNRDVKKVTFGLREISTQGTQFLINGRKTFIRGTLECAIFPQTGHPPTEIEPWRRIIRIAKAHGLNNLRFHSWCPPEAAFTAADELGMYLQVECSSWANNAFKNDSASLGSSGPTDAWIYAEAERILRFYGNHPSFVFMLYGNEPGGVNKNRFLSDWVNHFKTMDNRRLYSAAAGWPKLPENQFHVVPDPRIQAWGNGLKSRVNAQPPATTVDYRQFINSVSVPVISHEIGQWCVYPNFREKKKYTGYLKPKNFDIFYDRLRQQGLEKQAQKFLMASGHLQTLLYKEEIESALRTPAMAGFQLLDLHDFPGQGSALVGVLDPFWQEKGYVTAAEYRRFCNHTVLLARLEKRVFTNADTLAAAIEIAHFGDQPLHDRECQWRLQDSQHRVIVSGSLPAREIPIDNAISLGTIRIPLRGVNSPGQFQLIVSLQPGEIENGWDVWIYPDQVSVEVPAGVLVTDRVDEACKAKLQQGGKVMLFIPAGEVRGDAKTGSIALGFSSIFWNTAWTGRQPPHTLGILCDPSHPALAEFPTEYHSNWQWWYVVSRSGAMILDGLPQSLQPIVSVIDDWFTARKLGLVFEARVGKGRLLVCSAYLLSREAQNPVSRQMLSSLIQYINSAKFHPRTSLTLDQVRGLLSTDE